jgi:hypothetical protein
MAERAWIDKNTNQNGWELIPLVFGHRSDRPRPNVKKADRPDERQQSDKNQCQAEVNENGIEHMPSDTVARNPVKRFGLTRMEY